MLGWHVSMLLVSTLPWLPDLHLTCRRTSVEHPGWNSHMQLVILLVVAHFQTTGEGGGAFKQLPPKLCPPTSSHPPDCWYNGLHMTSASGVRQSL